MLVNVTEASYPTPISAASAATPVSDGRGALGLKIIGSCKTECRLAEMGFGICEFLDGWFNTLFHTAILRRV